MAKEEGLASFLKDAKDETDKVYATVAERQYVAFINIRV